jgi:hypothetical protein
MVEIFKTNVAGKRIAARIIKNLHMQLPDHHFNFDLDEPDKILRAQNIASGVQTEDIVMLVKAQGVAICLCS